ncbi:MAG: hypothetical protein ABFS86_14470 [Planctomycetota bacterium]
MVKRRPIFFSIVATAVVLLLGWLVVRSVPAAERARLEAAYRRDCERWGNPDDWEWVRPPIVGPAVEGTAADWYGRARKWVNEELVDSGFSPGSEGLLSDGLRFRYLSEVLLRTAREEPEYLAEMVAEYRPALDLVLRGARTSRSGRARALRDALLDYGSWGDRGIRDLVVVGAGEAIHLALHGDPKEAVDRMLANLRFAEDLARCCVCIHERPAVRALRFFAAHCDLPVAEEERLADSLARDLQDVQRASTVVARYGLVAQREYRALLDGTSTLFLVRTTAEVRDGPVLAAVDKATGMGFLPAEVLDAWRRTRRSFGHLNRLAALGADDRLMAAAHGMYTPLLDKEADGVVDRILGWELPGYSLHGVIGVVRYRIEKELVLYGIRLRQEWRRTGVRPQNLSGFLPPGVRERPGHRPWFLRPRTDADGLDLVWSGNVGISFQVRAPADPR